MKERYQFPKIAIKLLTEMPFIEEVDGLLEKEVKVREKTLTGHILRELRQEYIQIAINQLKNCSNHEQR